MWHLCYYSVTNTDFYNINQQEDSLVFFFTIQSSLILKTNKFNLRGWFLIFVWYLTYVYLEVKIQLYSIYYYVNLG